MYPTIQPANIDEIFDEIDADKNGVISKDEFKAALERMSYYDLIKVQQAAHANLEKKLEVVAKIENHMGELEANYEKKQAAYSNVGMMTASEIDALFEESKSKKKDIRTCLEEIKDLVAKAKGLFAE